MIIRQWVTTALLPLLIYYYHWLKLLLFIRKKYNFISKTPIEKAPMKIAVGDPFASMDFYMVCNAITTAVSTSKFTLESVS